MTYTNFELKVGEQIEIGGLQIMMNGVDREGAHPQYTRQEGDLAVNAAVTVSDGATTTVAKPLYYIRGSRPMHVKSFIPELGAHLKFVNIDPETETFYYSIARDDANRNGITVDIATNVPRNDIIVIEAIVFPGINLFWLGASLMMFGLFWAMFYKRREARNAS